MVLSPRLQITQSQKLMMNPQMQQAIQLLQLTNMQLNDMLAQEIEQNPFLAFDAADYRAAAPPKSVPKRDQSGLTLRTRRSSGPIPVASTLALRACSTSWLRPSPSAATTVSAAIAMVGLKFCAVSEYSRLPR